MSLLEVVFGVFILSLGVIFAGDMILMAAGEIVKQLHFFVSNFQLNSQPNSQL